MALTYIKSTGTDFTANSVTITTLYRGDLPLLCNDISTQFDNLKTVFELKQNQTSINTVVDSRDVQVTVNGQVLSPYVTEVRYPWITPYDSYAPGFRVVGSNLIIYNAPAVGDIGLVMVTSTSSSLQYRRYPYSAATIALGD